MTLLRLFVSWVTVWQNSGELTDEQSRPDASMCTGQRKDNNGENFDRQARDPARGRNCSAQLDADTLPTFKLRAVRLAPRCLRLIRSETMRTAMTTCGLCFDIFATPAEQDLENVAAPGCPNLS